MTISKTIQAGLVALCLATGAQAAIQFDGALFHVYPVGPDPNYVEIGDVSGDGGGDSDTPVTISAYDAANNFLGSGTDTYPTDYAAGKQMDLNFNNMKYLVMTSAGGQNNDNSVFWEVAASTPVPEPASLAILGLGALALIRRRSS